MNNKDFLKPEDLGRYIKLSDWIPAPEASECYMRIYNDTDPSNIANRVAFIEKTPRIRINFFTSLNTDYQNWEYGPKGSGEDLGSYQPSRDWCDEQLRAKGIYLL